MEVKGTQPEVQQWERRKIADGRVAAQHFQLQVGKAVCSCILDSHRMHGGEVVSVLQVKCTAAAV
jgi:hypothetical protein